MARLSTLVTGAALAALLALVPATATAATPGPAAVRVTVEGATKTLIAPETISTVATPVPRSGVSCSGTSAGGALETASAGAWAADEDVSAGLVVDAIRGERHTDAVDGHHWALSVNSVPVTSSPCALELNPGDAVLFYVSATPASAIPSSCRTNGRDGLCGSPDRTGPTGTITAPKEQQLFSAAHAPLTITGRVGPDPAGLADIRLRITRSFGRRCHYYSAIDETFLLAKKCGADGGEFFSIAQHATHWSYRLPRRPSPGRYTVDVQAVDTLGNPTDGLARGVDRIVFTVR